jgi:CspA family cold shock protein
MRGVVKFFDAKKGFGFIQPDIGGKDIFVHIKAIQKSGLDELQDGDKIEFELQEGRKGSEAIRIKLI